MIADAGADAIGLNFVPTSPRFVEHERAARIAAAVAGRLETVGVFVNAPSEAVLRAVESYELNAVQLHGDEPPEFLAELRDAAPDLPIIRVWRMGPDGLKGLADHLDTCKKLGALPQRCLIDSLVPGVYGGSGTAVAWDRLAAEYDSQWPPLILAGGLRPENVAEAVRVVRPFGVDTASGVESEPGIKDPAAVARFIAAARSGDEAMRR
jgi:phosphoribosylanthranilate isomerase